MSIQAMVWVLELSQSEGYDRLVLLAIANHCDAHGCNAWPSYDQMAREAHVDRGTVWRCLQRLQALGEVEVTQRGRGRGSRNEYRLPMKMVAQRDLIVGNGRGEALEMVAPTRLEPSFKPKNSARARVCTREGADSGPPGNGQAQDETTPRGGDPDPPGTIRPREWHGDPPVTEADRERSLARVRAMRGRPDP